MTFFHQPPRRTDKTGVALAHLHDIPDGQGKGFDLIAGDGSIRTIFAVRQGEAVYGYRNVCPHAGTPLDFKPDTFFTPDGTELQCSTHGARFRIADGACLAGPCRGKGLTPVPLTLDAEGWIRLAPPACKG